MSLRRVLAIVRKDVLDALRDGRVAVLLAMPIALAVFYNATVSDEEDLPQTSVVLVGDAAPEVGTALRDALGRSIELEVREAPDAAAAQRLLDAEDADLAVVLPAAGTRSRPAAEVLVPPGAGPAAQGVAAFVPGALARAAGLETPVEVRVRAYELRERKPADVVGQRQVTVLITILLLGAFVAMMVVPMQVAEEVEAQTFGALRLAATGPEVLAAKALAGLAYTAAGVVLTVVLTGLDVHEPVAFAAAALGMVASLVGFGLLLGLVVGNANAINTYGGFGLLPLLALGSAVFLVDEGWPLTAFDVLPITQAMRLMADALASEQPFDPGAVAWLVLVAWTAAGALGLARLASRREL